MKGGFVITVDFTLKPGAMHAFRQMMDRNAIDSCKKEPGCRRFDVLTPAGEPNRIFLYEIYDSRAAFEEHLKSSHFQTFNTESAPLIVSKKISEYELVCEGTAG